MTTSSVRVLHVLWEHRPLDTYPPLYNALYMLGAAGFECDVASPGPVGSVGHLLRNKIDLTGRFFVDASFLAKVAKAYTIVVAYLPRDLAMLGLCRAVYGLRPTVVYHSIEIETPCYARAPLTVRTKHYLRRPLHQYAYRRVAAIVIQDAVRAELLRRIYGPNSAPLFTVPNAFIQHQEPMSSGVAWFDKLLSGRRIAAYVGGLSQQFLPPETVCQLGAFKDWVFVIAGWGSASNVEDLGRTIESRAIKNVMLRGPVGSRADLNYVVSRSDLGICLYDPSDDNQRYMGMSSGKYHKYLSYGKPVLLTDDLLGLSDFTKHHHFGICLREMRDLMPAMQSMSLHLSAYARSVCDKYHKLCNFEAAYAPVVSQVQRLLATQ